jgi:hypothetical protein
VSIFSKLFPNKSGYPLYPSVRRKPFIIHRNLSLIKHTLDLGNPCAKLEIKHFQLCVDSAGNRYVSDNRPVTLDHAFASRVFAGAVIAHRVMRLKSPANRFRPVQPLPTCASKAIRLNTVFRVRAQNSPDGVNVHRIVGTLPISHCDSCNCDMNKVGLSIAGELVPFLLPFRHCDKQQMAPPLP